MMDTVVFGDCRDSMIAMIGQGVKVQMCVTSPPYFGLRDYGTGTWTGGDPACAHSVGGQVQDTKAPGAIVSGVRPGCDASTCRKCGATREDKQIGLEQTPAEYVAAMVEVFSLVWYLLADDGVLWINLGDSYFSTSKGTGGSNPETSVCQGRKGRENFQAFAPVRISAGSTGLKPKDLIGIPWRVAFALQEAGWYLRQDIIWHKPNPMPESVTDRCTKAHEYLFLLSKMPRYYFDSEAIAEPADPRNYRANPSERTVAPGQTAQGKLDSNRGGVMCETRNKRSVWTVTPKPYKGAHFATFPPALIEPCVLAGSRPGDIILDPFMGSGTTAQVAKQHGRHWLGCELNPEYEVLQQQRLTT